MCRNRANTRRHLQESPSPEILSDKDLASRLAASLRNARRGTTWSGQDVAVPPLPVKSACLDHPRRSLDSLHKAIRRIN